MIKEFKISLMEKSTDFNIDDQQKGEYIIKSTASFSPNEYLQKINKSDLSTEEYNQYILDSSELIYKNIFENNPDLIVDAIGLWFELESGDKIENAMDLNTLNLIGEYNNEIIPIVEFVKITLGMHD